MRLSPYGSDIGRLGRLVLRPNWSWRAAAAPEDAAFPEDGLLHIAQAIPPSLCDRAVADYERFEAFREQRRCLIRDEQGRNLRVANLHLKSQALLSIGLDRAFHGPAADFFRRDSVLYTSLTFKHGSQQLAHIDTPFFWTRPANLFVGVWIALEDVREQAGPLFYYPGSHRLLADEDRMLHFYRKAQHNVDEMFELMRIEVEKTIRREPVIIKKGDAVIWHPGILHGGLPATDPAATRYSAVFHFAAKGVNIRYDRFPSDFANLPVYGLCDAQDRAYCRVSLPAAMV